MKLTIGGFVRDVALFALALAALLLLNSYLPAQSTEALDEVNAIRKANGLTPYVRDDGLTQAAARCAETRAAALCAGHTSNDFLALSPGVLADAAGCAAWEPSMGWGSCAIFDDYQFGGAAFVYGRDGKRYMHLFVRGGSGRAGVQTVPIQAAVAKPPKVAVPGCTTGSCPIPQRPSVSVQATVDVRCPGGDTCSGRPHFLSRLRSLRR